MIVKDIIDEDFANYKKPSMLIATCYCNFKCCKEQNIPIAICQNEPINRQPNVDIPMEKIFHRYIANPISKAIIFAGLEPMLQFEEMLSLIRYFRNNQCNDDVVIYTGYYPHEIEYEINKLQELPNIIVKFGRYVQKSYSKYDDVLGINLISDNQFAIKIS